jgi:hypothetical protein
MTSIEPLDDRGQLYVEEEDSDYVDDESSEYEEYEYESDDELVEQSDEGEGDDAGEVESSHAWRRYLIGPQAEPASYEESRKREHSFLLGLNKLPRILPLDSPHILSENRRIMGDEPCISSEQLNS